MSNPMEWQPIETATPKHGDQALLWRTGNTTGEWPFHGQWSETSKSWQIYIDGQGLDPTHWMPLPTPPAMEE